MPPSKLPNSVAKLVVELAEQQKEPAEIAQILNIKKVQVTTLLAYHRQIENKVHADQEESTTTFGTNEPTESLPASDDKAGIEPQQVAVLDATGAELDPHEGKTTGDGVYVGDDADYGDAIYWNPQDAGSVPNPHLMIMGESGSGKTYAVQCLVAELAQRAVPSILFDYGQSFELQHLEASFKKFTGIREHLIGEQGLPINPLQIFPKDTQGPRSVATRVSDVFDAAYHLGDIQRKVVIDAIRSAFEKAGVSESNSSTWKKDLPSLVALQNVLEEMSANKEYPNYKNAVGVAARLMTFFMLTSFRVDAETWSWDSLLNDAKHRVHVLQFRGLEGKTQRVLVELLLWHLFFYLKSHGQSPLRLYCVLDEAHHLSFREGGPVDSLLREARKFGLGIMFASQQPEDFSPAAFSNSASKLIFQTSDPTLKVSKLLSSKCSNYSSPEDIKQVISVLPQGRAFFITKNRGHVVTLADFKKRATLWHHK
jgi:DNA phosphorothioation-dependent restriction protein DptH